MEARLFFISIWWGIYGQILRKVSSNQSLIKKPIVVAVLNAFFWATGGVIAGMLTESYFLGTDINNVYAVRFAIIGAVIGAVIGFVKAKEKEKRDFLVQDNLEWADTCFSAILLASLVMYFIIQAFKIPSGSMRMTFVEGDHLFVNKFIYGIHVPFSDKKIFPFNQVKRGDIVIFRFPSDEKDNPHYGKDFIKRAVALEGQTVQVKDKELYVDGQLMDEPYKQHVDSNIYRPSYEIDHEVFQEQWSHPDFRGFGGNDIRDNFGPVTIPLGHVMVMGDNRDRSYDSRFWGPLPLQMVKGRAGLLYWPFSRFKVVHKKSKQ